MVDDSGVLDVEGAGLCRNLEARRRRRRRLSICQMMAMPRAVCGGGRRHGIAILV